MAGNKAASLNPANFTSGGAVADGEYNIEACCTDMFDYGGSAPDTPCIAVTYKGEDGTLTDQHYSAGKAESLIASDDGKNFVHPSGEEAHINKSSNASAWLASILNAGFPVSKMGEDVGAFVGTRVQIVNQAQPKRPGLKDHVEGKTIPLVTKVLSLPGEKKAAARPQQAAGGRRPVASAAAKTAPATAGDNGAANLTDAAIEAVQVALAEAPNNSLTRLKLSTAIMLRLAKAKDPNMAQVKKLASTPEWLIENAIAGGWVSDGENVELGTE